MKRLFYPALAVLSASCILMASCSKVDSNDLKDEIPYYQEYEVSYNKSTNKTNAAASFRVRESSGAKVELTNNAGVTMNGIKGQSSLTDKTQYKWDLSGLNDASFSLTKNSGVTISNNVSKSTAIGDIEIINLPDSISKSAGFSFDWTGSSLRSDESIKAIIGSTIGGVNLYSKDVSGTHITFSSTELSVVPVGNIRVTLKRQRELPLENQDGNAGGKITVSLETYKDTKTTD